MLKFKNKKNLIYREAVLSRSGHMKLFNNNETKLAKK